MKKILLLLAFVSALSFAQTTKGDGSIVFTTSDEYWSGTITLDGKYVVADGHTVTIAPGTVIKAKAKGVPADASAFVVAKGGKVDAIGTPSQPIIFTTEYDPLDGTNLETPGQWGGVVILGNALVGTDSGEASIEGIPANLGLVYGGSDDTDDSGTLQYVSIRYGGTALATDSEINGLTLGGVGSGTTLDNIEVIYNDDDGIEFFGGTVNASNLLIWSQADDAVDVDMAYSGTISNVVVAMGTGSDNVFEIDGTEDTTTPILDRPHTVTNVTAIGISGNKADALGHWKSNAKGSYSNIYYRDFDAGTTTEGVVNYNSGLTFSNVEITTTDAAAAAFPTINADVTVTSSPTVGANVNAFNWTFYTANNTFPSVTKGDGSIVFTTSDEYWSGTITLDGKYVVADGHTVTIAPGTVIKAKAKGVPADASAFVVAKGGKVDAIGTPSQPIIFTTEYDPLDGTNLETPGQWGGVVILGNALVGTDSGEASIEGIPANLGLVYGGSDDTDDSGTLQYVSIRYGGTALATDSEINGLTLGGVGSGTTLDNIEVIYNDDDGIEFFGGTVNASNLLIWSQADDAVDVDMAYSGTISNVVVAMGTGSDNVFEIDGTEDTTTPILDRPHTVTNVTAIGISGNKADALGHWKSNAKGSYSNIYYRDFDAGTTTEGVVNYNSGLTFSNVEICTTDAAAAAFPTINADVTVTCTPSSTVGANTNNLSWTFYAANNMFSHSATLSNDIIIEDVQELRINLYPNPTTDMVNVNGNVEVKSLILYNISGQRLRTSNDNSMDVSDLQKGLYIINVETSNETISKRLIKR